MVLRMALSVQTCCNHVSCLLKTPLRAPELTTIYPWPRLGLPQTDRRTHAYTHTHTRAMCAALLRYSEVCANRVLVDFSASRYILTTVH